MGATFVNIQVYTRNADTRARLDEVQACLRSVLHEDGLLPVEADQASDRTILVAAGKNWIGVYDELCDEQLQDVASRLASELSRQLETQAITIVMHDSDVLWLELFDSGTVIDSFNDNPDYFVKVSSEERKSARGKPERWNSVLAPGATSAALRGVWRKRTRFAEDTLRETATLLGLDENLAQVGFRYLQQADGEFDDTQLLRLGFRHLVRPAHEIRAQGQPRFEFNSSSANNVAVVGSVKQFGGCSVRNMGGALHGLSLVLSGDALERGLLSISSVQLVVSLGEQRTLLTAPTEGELRGEQRVSVASFPELELAAGPSYAHHSLSATSVHALLFGEGLSLGAGVVHVGFVPHGAAQGQAVISLKVEVFAPARPPLRAAELAPSGPQRPKHVLFARVSMDLEQHEAAAAAVPMIERYCDFLGPSGELSLTIFSNEPSARPRKSKAKLSSLPRSARWQKFRSEFERAACASGDRKVPVEDVFARRPSDGFSFGGSIHRHELAGDPELPTLVLWFDLENVPTERASAAEALFEAFMADVMVHHSGVQALVGRASTMSAWSIDLSEYEAACGIHGFCTLRRSWLSHFVRGVHVGTLWLGASLVRLIPDMAALETAAQVEPFGRALKVMIASEAELASVERALAPLLPSPEDARLATDRLYGR